MGNARKAVALTLLALSMLTTVYATRDTSISIPGYTANTNRVETAINGYKLQIDKANSYIAYAKTLGYEDNHASIARANEIVEISTNKCNNANEKLADAQILDNIAVDKRLIELRNKVMTLDLTEKDMMDIENILNISKDTLDIINKMKGLKQEASNSPGIEEMGKADMLDVNSFEYPLQESEFNRITNDITAKFTEYTDIYEALTNPVEEKDDADAVEGIDTAVSKEESNTEERGNKEENTDKQLVIEDDNGDIESTNIIETNNTIE